ncbi:hypothetical protein GGD62_008413, partial [Bradyrhizobium sp. ERR14]|nr:hypothetical protein [Bradyrhizobium sp. ERR14]
MLKDKSWHQKLALLWQIVDFVAFYGIPNQFFNDSWVVGSWR